VSIQEEIHIAMKEIQNKVSNNEELSRHEMEILFLTSLIEDEA